MDHAEVCVIGCQDAAVIEALECADDRCILDLVRLPDAQVRRTQPGYVGIGW